MCLYDNNNNNITKHTTLADISPECQSASVWLFPCCAISTSCMPNTLARKNNNKKRKRSISERAHLVVVANIISRNVCAVFS